MTESLAPTSNAGLPAKTALPWFVGPDQAVKPDEWAAMDPATQHAVAAYFQDELKETTDGLPSVNFPRVKYPSSGSAFWQVPAVGGQLEPIRELEGIVVFKQPVRAYWPIDQAVGNKPPTCSSLDGITPVEGPGKQADKCATCRWSQWDTGRNARGQACKSRLNTFILRANQDIPTLVSLPPTALRTFSDFAVQLRQARLALVAVTTVFGLHKETAGGGEEYMGLELKVGHKLAFAEMQTASKIRDIFRTQMERRGIVDEEEETAPAGSAQVIDAQGHRLA